MGVKTGSDARKLTDKKEDESVMKKLVVALMLAMVALSPAGAQFLVVPDGAIGPDGKLAYAVPSGAGAGPGCPYPQGFGPGIGPAYPVYYPALWVPALIPPDAIDRQLNRINPPQQ